MNKTLIPRKRIFVDPELQSQLVLRVVIYWTMCVATVVLMAICWRTISGPARPFYRHLDELWFHLGPAVLASFILLPIVIIDVIRVSNRFVGPLLRLRQSVRSLAAGRHVEPITFRQGDFWRGFADEFNALVTRVKELEIAGYRNRDTGVDPWQEERPPANKSVETSETSVVDFALGRGNWDNSLMHEV